MSGQLFNNSYHLMYTQVWKKFIPIIRLMMKRSVTTNQVVKMNRTDFDKAGGGRKAGFNFLVEMKNGRINNRFNSPMAVELVQALQADEQIMATMSQRTFQLEMNPKCELSIRFLPDAAAIEAPEISLN